MLSSQLFWRLFGVYAVITLATGLAFGVILSYRQTEAFRTQARQRLLAEGAGLAAVLGRLDSAEDAALAETTRTLSDIVEPQEFAAGLITPQGRVLWRIRWEDLTTLVDLDSPDVVAVRDSGEGFADVLFPGATIPDMVYSRRVTATETDSPILRLRYPLDRSLRDQAAARQQLWAAAATIGIIALAINYVVVGRIIGPLETLTQAAQQLAAGEHPPEVAIRSRNEIGTLARVFNSMSRQLAARIHDLQDQRLQVETDHQRLETILGAMNEGVIAVDAEDRILFANPAAIRLMDLKPTSMFGRPLWEQVRQEALQRVVRQAAEEGGLPRVEFDVARTQSTVGVTASRLPGNPAPGVVVVMHDVTELRRLENLRRDFVQNVSHELKTPLSSIAAYADTLLEGGLEDAASNRLFVERIAEQADRLHRLILDLLALAKMEAGEEAYDVEPTDVSRIATACIDAHQGVARAKRIELATEAPAGAIWGYADDDGLRTILDNLLDNAVNYTPENGRIVVRWSREGGRVLIQVRDTGPGIAHEHQQRIFQRFYRIDKARSRELGGTGLGLSIVKHLCQLFGGTISVQSQLGQGSAFTVELRAAA